MRSHAYQQFCPVAMACEVLEPRWTMLILCEMWSGSTRFSEIQRGVPGMSPSLLSRRLREMGDKGLLTRTTGPDGRIDYRTTPMADELEPLVHALGAWAHRRLDPSLQLEHLDHHLLMWNIRRKVQAAELPRRSLAIQFILKTEGTPDHDYWLLVGRDGETDLCMIDPRSDVDLFVCADLRALTSAWMGHTTFAEEMARERIVLIGDRDLATSLPRWLRRSSYACADEPTTALAVAGLTPSPRSRARDTARA